MSTTLITNPYSAVVTLGTTELQLLLFGAVVCFVTGVLLAEARTLRRMISIVGRPPVRRDSPRTIAIGAAESA